MRVDPARLRGSAPRFTELSRDLDGAFTRLVAVLSEQGECWGRDATGAQFAATYSPASDQTARLAGELVDAVADVGFRLLTAADQAEAADERARTRLT
jgi:uncharacterized protein YukE